MQGFKTRIAERKFSRSAILQFVFANLFFVTRRNQIGSFRKVQNDSNNAEREPQKEILI